MYIKIKQAKIHDIFRTSIDADRKEIEKGIPSHPIVCRNYENSNLFKHCI